MNHQEQLIIATIIVGTMLVMFRYSDLKESFRPIRENFAKDASEEVLAGKNSSSDPQCQQYPGHPHIFRVSNGSVCKIKDAGQFKGPLCEEKKINIPKCIGDAKQLGDKPCYRVRDNIPIYKLRKDDTLCWVPDQKMVDSPVCGGNFEYLASEHCGGRRRR